MAARPSNRLRRRKIRLFEEDPHCHFCGCEVWLPPPNQTWHDFITAGLNLDAMATIEHLDPRFSDRRGKTRGPRTVLCCKKCNCDRNVEFMNSFSKEERNRLYHDHE